MKGWIVFWGTALLLFFAGTVLAADTRSIESLLSSSDPPLASEDLDWDGSESDDLTFDGEIPENAIDELMKALKKDPNAFDGTPYGIEGNYTIVQEASGNIISGSSGRVRLVALRKSDGIYDRSLLFEIAPSEGEPFLVPLSEDVRGFESKFEMKNFTSKDKVDLLLSVQGNQSETARFLIVAIESHRGKIIYDSEKVMPPTIVGRFIDRYRAEMFVEENGYRALIDLSSRKAAYDRRQVYNEGSGILRNSVNVWKSGQSLLQPIDTDNDGIYELKGITNVSGLGRADLIAYVETTLKYANGAWQILDIWIAPAEDLAHLPQPIRLR